MDPVELKHQRELLDIHYKTFEILTDRLDSVGGWDFASCSLVNSICPAVRSIRELSAALEVDVDIRPEVGDYCDLLERQAQEKAQEVLHGFGIQEGLDALDSFEEELLIIHAGNLVHLAQVLEAYGGFHPPTQNSIASINDDIAELLS